VVYSALDRLIVLPGNKLENPDLPWLQVFVLEGLIPTTGFRCTGWVFTTVNIEDRGFFIETALILAIRLERQEAVAV